MPEILIWVSRILLNGDAVHEFWAPFGYDVILGALVMVTSLGFGDRGGGEIFVVDGEATVAFAGSGGGSHAAGVCVLANGDFGFWGGLMYVRGLSFATATASICCEYGSKKASLVGRH